MTCSDDCVYLCLWPFPQQLESLVWERSGNLFVCSHNDGGYSVWAVTSGNTCNHQPVSSTIPYGEKCIHHMSHNPPLLHFKCRSETFSGLEDRVEPVTDSWLHSDENKCFSWELAVAPHTGCVRCIFPSHANCFQNLFTCHFTFLSRS